MKIGTGLAKIGSAIAKHSPEILTALGIIGLVSAGVSAVKNTPKALDILKEAEEQGEVLTVKTKVKLCWKQYIFPVAIALLSIISIIFARRIDSGRTAALLTACKVSEEAAERFETETREVVGDKEIAKIEDRIAKKDISNKPVVDEDVIRTNGGESLYYECYSGRYFRANRDYIDRAKNEFNARLIDNDYMSINDWLECLNLPYLDDETTGSMLGWEVGDVRRKCGGHMPEVMYSYHPASNGEPCGHIRMECRPTVDYNS